MMRTPELAMNMTSSSLRVVATLCVTFGVIAGTACVDREFVAIEKDEKDRPIGDTCQLNDECASGRCVAGLCDDGDCSNDEDCRATEICVFGECADASEFDCHPGQAPILSLSSSEPLGSPPTVDFGNVRHDETRDQVVSIQNIGDCILTLSNIGLKDDSDPEFDCSPCDPGSMPQYVPPGRTLDVHALFTPTEATTGRHAGTADADFAAGDLQIRSDDPGAGPEGLVTVHLRGENSGLPSLTATPLDLNFGYVALGSSKTLEVTLRNTGTGAAALELERVFVDHAVVFEIPEEYGDVNPDEPLIIPPYDSDDPDSEVVISVTFTPSSNADYDDSLMMRPLGGDNIAVFLSGSSLGPPNIDGNASNLEYKCRGAPDDPCPLNEAYPVGLVAFRQVKISNTGQSDLDVTLALGGEASDFSLSPNFIPPIPAGGFVFVSVFFNPSGPSDPANPGTPTQPFDAVLSIASNDSGDPLKTVSLKGWSKKAQNDQILKLEMTFENADNSWAGNDYRNVDLELESPTGANLCAKPVYSYTPGPDGPDSDNLPDSYTPVIQTNYCGDWSDSAIDEGNVNWLALGAYEEPERIVLSGLGPTGGNGQTYTIRAHYIEDCSNIPTGFLADIVGIGTSVIVGVVSIYAGVPIPVNPAQVSDLVASNCWDTSSSLVTLHIYLDGVQVAAPQQRLNGKGDIAEWTLDRVDGEFCNDALGIPCP